MSKIIDNRKSEYTRLSKSKNHPRVFAGKLKGIVYPSPTPYSVCSRGPTSSSDKSTSW